MYLDMNKVKRFAKETNATAKEDGLEWPGPKETPGNSLFIPFSDLGRSPKGIMYRVSIRPDMENTLLRSNLSEWEE